MAWNRHRTLQIAISAMAERSAGDNITLCVGIAAAVVSSMFAGYAWINGPSDDTDGRLIFQYVAVSPNDETRTDVQPIRPTVGSRQSVEQADSISTASLASESNQPDNTAAGSYPATSMRPLDRYILLGIYADTALVTGTGSAIHQLWPVKIGSVVPGAGRVIALITDGESPSVLTTKGVISVAGAEQ